MSAEKTAQQMHLLRYDTRLDIAREAAEFGAVEKHFTSWPQKPEEARHG